MVTQVETIDANHRALREHYGCLIHAVSMLEATDQVAQEQEANPTLYRMLVGALRTLAENPNPLVRLGVLLEAALARGLPPAARRLLRPLRRRQWLRSPRSTSRRAGCCAQGAVASAVVGSTPTRLDMVRRILGGDLHGALAEPPGPTTVATERLALTSLREHHLERRLRSAALL